MLRRFVLIACLSLAAFGCSSDDRPPRARTTGTVTYNGKPVAGASVVFQAPKAPRFSTATTDSNGKFALTTYDEGDGAMLGLNQVSVTKVTAGSQVSADLNSPEYARTMMSQTKGTGPKSDIPTKYNDPKTSALSFTVTAGGPNDFEIKLQD